MNSPFLIVHLGMVPLPQGAIERPVPEGGLGLGWGFMAGRPTSKLNCLLIPGGKLPVPVRQEESAWTQRRKVPCVPWFRGP